MEYLDLQEVRHVQGLVRLRNPLPDGSGFRPTFSKTVTAADVSRKIKDR